MNAHDYFHHQITMPSVGASGQERLAASSVLVVGCGGLGCPAAQYLAASGVGHIGLCDYDEIEYGNISRQILFDVHDVGKQKAETARQKLSAFNPHTRYTVHGDILHEENARGVIQNYDVVLDCADNFHATYVIHDTCFLLRKNVVQGSVFQKHGQIFMFPFSRHHNAKQNSPGCLRCLWKEEPQATCVASCSDGGVLSIVAGTVGVAMATYAVRALFALTQKNTVTSLYQFETDTWNVMPLLANKKCPLCSKSSANPTRSIRLEFDYIPDKSWVVLDVRNEDDQHECDTFYTVRRIKNRERVDTKTLAQLLDTDTNYMLVCYAGRRSLDMARALRACGMKAHSFARGFEYFARI